MVEYITGHSAEFIAMGGALMILGGLIVKLTPTKTDDKWWAKLTEVVGKLTKKA